MNYSLRDLFDLNQFQNLLDKLNELYPFPSAILDPEENVLVASGWQDICTKFHRINPDCARDCRASDAYIREHLHEANPAVSYHCPRGLVDCALPIVIDGVHYATFFAGQFLTEPPDMAAFHEQAQRYGFDTEGYLAAVARVPVVNTTQLEKYLSFVKNILDLFTSNALKTLRETEALRQKEASEQRANTILSQMLDAFWIYDAGGRILDTNPALCSMLGYPHEELLTKTLADIAVNDAPDVINERIRKTIENGSSRFESELRRKDGSMIQVDVSTSYLPDRGWFFGFHRDITERKRLEHERARSEHRFRALFNGMLNGFAYCRMIHEEGAPPDFEYIEVNPAFEALTGLSGVAGKRVSDVIPGIQKTNPGLFEIYGRVAETGTPETFEDYIPPIDMWFSVSVYSPQQGYFVAIFEIVTQRKRAEAALEESRRFVQRIIETSPSSLYIYNLVEHRNVFVNREISTLLGYTPEQIQAMGSQLFALLLHPDDLPLVGAHHQRLASLTTPDILDTEYRMKDASGHWRWIYSRDTVFSRAEDGSVCEILGTATDITERIHSELALQESEENYRRLFETMTQGVVYQAPTGEIISANPAAECILGLTLDQMRGRTSMDPAWQSIREDGSPLPGSEHPAMIALRTGRPVERTIMGVSKPGAPAPTWIRVTAIPLFRPRENTPYTVYATFEDLTIERQAIDNYRMLFREMLDGFALHEIICDQAGKPVDYRFLAVNPAFEKMTGLRGESIVGRTVTAIIPGIEYGWIERYGRVARTGNPEYFEDYAAGLDKHFEVTAFCPSPGQFACIFRDVTDSKQFEKKLIETNDHLIRAQRASHTGLWDWDIVKGTIEWSSEMYQVFDLDPATASASFDTWRNRLHPADVKLAEQRIMNAVRDHHPLINEYRIVTSAGNIRWINAVGDTTYDKSGNPLRMSGLCIDITERKQAEQAIQESEERNKIVAEMTTDYVFIADVDPASGLKLRWTSENMARVTGRSIDDAKTRELWNEIIHPDDRPAFADLIRKATSSPAPQELECRSKTIAGSERWIHIYARPQLNEHGAIVSIVGAIKDVTERRTTEEKLNNTMILLEETLEQSPIPMVLVSMPDMIVRVANKACLDFIGMPEAAFIVGNPLTDLVPTYQDYDSQGNLSAPFDVPLPRSLQGIKTVNEERKLVHKDGAVRWGLMSAMPIYNKRGELIAGYLIMNDITARKEAEEERERLHARLLESQKLESIGILASGIAHDFNNILGAIGGNAELIEQKANDVERTRHHAHAIAKSSERGAQLVKQLLTIARKTRLERETADVNALVMEMVKLIEETFPKTIRVETGLQRDLPETELDPTQFHQVLLNLCLNARDAMPDGGVIRFETGLRSGSSVQAAFGDAPFERYLEISVRDSGTGMDDTTRRHIFEPFFSTKERGKGTGLGLAVASGIIQNHQGHIEVVSRPGRGSQFTIYLPVVVSTRTAAAAPARAQEAQAGGAETILFVEDEPLVMDMAVEFLSGLGYLIVRAVSGPEAVERFTEHRADIRLVLSDFGLPGFDGERLFHHLKDLDPHVRFVLATGYIDPVKKEEFLQRGMLEVAHKPYRLAELATLVRKALDAGKKG